MRYCGIWRGTKMYNSDEYRYSLCIVYTGNNGQNISYRVADYFPEEGRYEEAVYTDKYEDFEEYNPSIIGANPDELELGAACVRKWKPQEYDGRRQWSYSYNAANVYEILLNSDILKAVDQEGIINILSSGIDIPWYVNNNFLLPISQKGSDFEMILCSKKDFVPKGEKYAINNSVSDMLHTTHEFDKYEIKKGEWIDNNLLRRTLNNPDLISEKRFFYAFDNLPPSCGIFIPRSADAYITAFLKWYCRKKRSLLEITKRESDKLIELMEFAIDSEDELLNYLKNSPFGRDEIVDALTQRVDYTEKFLRGNSDLDAVIKHVLSNSQDLYEECVRIATDIWMEKESALREAEKEKTQKAIAEREAFEKETDKLVQELQKLRGEITTQQKELDSLRNEIDEANVYKEKVSIEIRDQLKGFKSDIVQTIKTMGIVDSLGGLRQDENKDYFTTGSVRVYQAGCGIQAYDTDSDTMEDFYEDLSDNLSIWFENPADIAAFIIACFANEMGIIVAGSVGTYVATAYSMLVDGATPLQVEISNGDKSIFEAAEIINRSNSRTIYVQGLMDSFRETSVGTILRLCPNKDLFFSVGNVDEITLMSSALFDKTLLLDVEKMFKIIPDDGDDEYGLSISHHQNGLVVDKNTEEIKKIYNRYLLKLCKGNIIRKFHAVRMAYVIHTYYSLYPDKVLGDCMKDAFKQLCINNPDESEQVEEALKLPKA